MNAGNLYGMGTTEPFSFVSEPPASDEVERLYADDRGGRGYVMNTTRVWAHTPGLIDGLGDLIGSAANAAGLTRRQKGVLITSCTSTLGDSYCPLAWSDALTEAFGADVAGAVLSGDDAALPADEQVLARWARRVTRDPNGTTAADVDALRACGFDDQRIVAITAFIAFRLALAIVNDALGARPDAELVASLPTQVREAVTYGRAPADG